MDRKMEEQVIYPKDLLFAALYRWKIALILALVLGLLLGGMQLARGGSSVDPATMDAYQEALTIYQEESLLRQQAVDYWENELKNHRAYLRESVFMSLDPDAHYRGSIMFHVSTDYQIQPDKAFQTPDTRSYLVTAYEARLNQDDTVLKLAETVGLSWRLFWELYEVSADQDSSSVTVFVRHKDQVAVEKLMTALQAQIFLIRDELAAVGEHELVIMGSGVGLVADQLVSETIRENMTILSTLKEQLTLAEEDLASLTAPVAPQAAAPSVKKAVVFGVLGFVAGFALVAVYAWFVHMESDKLYSTRLLRLRLGMRILGTLQVSRFGVIDQKLRKLEGRDMADTAKKATLLACDIRNRCSGKVLLTGTGDSQERAALAQAMTEAGIAFTDPGSLRDSAAAVEALKTADAVVLAEKCGSALCSEIYAETQTVFDYGKELLGCVVLDG